MGEEVRVVKTTRPTIVTHTNRSDEVEPQSNEVGQIILTEWFVAKVGVNQPDAPKTPFTGTGTAQIGNE